MPLTTEPLINWAVDRIVGLFIPSKRTGWSSVAGGCSLIADGDAGMKGECLSRRSLTVQHPGTVCFVISQIVALTFFETLASRTISPSSPHHGSGAAAGQDYIKWCNTHAGGNWCHPQANLRLVVWSLTEDLGWGLWRTRAGRTITAFRVTLRGCRSRNASNSRTTHGQSMTLPYLLGSQTGCASTEQPKHIW